MTIAWLWLRAHRWPALAATCGATALVGLLFGGDHVPLPSLADTRRLSVPLGQLLPLVLASAIGLHSRTPTTLFHVAPRAPIAQRAALAGTLLATAIIACASVPDGLAALRNTLGLGGMALVAATVAGATRSWTLPLCYLMACLLFGSRVRSGAGDGSRTQWWAFALAEARDRNAMVSAIACCAVGLVLFVLRGPRDEVTSHE
ncbi:hypothetical protein ACRAKI_19290 [Saccharothrix isguenensis]